MKTKLQFKNLRRTARFLKVLFLLLLTLPAMATDYYWVGGSGTWTDISHHWATTSGGAVFHPQVPSQFDRVIFDANSFSASGQEVTMNVEGFCKEFRSRNVLPGVKFTSTKPLNVYEGMSIDSNMIWSQTGNLIISTGGFTLGKSVTFYLNGTFSMPSGAFTLLNGATYNQPGGACTVTNGLFTLNVGSSFTHTGGQLYIGNSSLTINAGSTFYHQGGITLNMGSLTVNTGATYRENSGTLQMNNGSVNIQREATFYQNGTFNINVGSFTLGSKSTYTQYGDMNMGNGAFTMGDTVTWTKNNSINQNRGDFKIGTDNTFYINSGNVLNDVFGDFYIGARTTFSPNCCTVRTSGHFYFDVTTIINTSASIQIGIGNLVLDSGMRWTCNNVLYLWTGSLIVKAGARFSHNNHAYVYGSLDIDSAAIYTGTTQYYMRGTGTGLYIKSGNRDLRRIQFDGNNGQYTFMDDAIFSSDGIFMYGNGNNINFNGKKIKAYHFYHWDGNPITINLTGTDTVFVKGQYRIYSSANVIGNPVIYYDGTDHFYMISLNNKVYDKVYMKAQNTGGTQIQFQNNSKAKSVEILASGTQQLYFDNVTIDKYDITYLQNYNTTVLTQFNNGAHIDTLNITSNYNIKTNLVTNGSNYLGRVNIPKITQWTIGANQTQTLVSMNPLNGVCGGEFSLNSNSIGTAGTISMTNDSLKGNWLKIQDCRAIGGAVFIADNTVNFGNVTGWIINSIPPRDFYWVGGTGNWNDPNHWAFTSGGVTSGCALPNKVDNVIFDTLSFSASGQYVNVNVTVDVNNMTWDNVKTGARFEGGGEFNLWGSLVLHRNMVYNFGGNFNFVSRTLGKTVFTDGVRMRTVWFGRDANASTGSWTLLDNFDNDGSWFYFVYGKLITNGKNIKTFGFHNWHGPSCVIDWTGTDTVQVQYMFISYNPTTWISRPGLVIFDSYNHFYIYGGNHTLNDVLMNARSTGSTYIEISQNTTLRDVKINAYGTQYMTLHHQLTMRDFEFNYLLTNNVQQNLDFQTNPGIFRNLKILSSGLMRPQIYFRYQNTVDSLVLPNISRLYFAGGYTKYINKYLKIQGACDNRIPFYSDGLYGYITSPAGTDFSVDWVNMQRLKGQGGATFNATHVLNLGDNVGWNITPNPTTNYYWVGGSGDWSDKNHWSFTSGGTPGVCPMPERTDNVIFDVNSFTGPNQYVNVNTSANCLSMTWNNVNFPRIIGGGDLNIYGSMTLDSKLSWQHTNWTYFRSTTTGNTVTTKGVNMYLVNFAGTGEWTLGDNFKAQYDIYVNSGTFNSGGKTITLGRNFYCWTGNPTTVNLTGTDTISVTNEFRIYPNNFNLTMGNAVVKFTGTNHFYFTGGGKTYTDLVFNADNTGSTAINIAYNNSIRNVKINAAGYQQINMSSSSTYNDVTMLFRNTTTSNPTVNVSGNNTFNDMTITSIGTAGPFINLYNNNTYNNLIIAGVGTRIFIGANQTQTVNDALALGSGSYPVFLQSTSQGTQGTINKPFGNICMDYIWLRDLRVIGTGTFNAGATSTNLGNNTNWSFTSCAGYYWVGGTGNWSDYAHHWAYASGGTILHNTVPTEFDDVYFDANSFTTAGEVVTVDVNEPKMRNLSWASALYTPTLTGTVSSTEMNVYGSIKLITNMNQNFTGDWNFKSPNDSNDINTAGKTLTRVNFVGGNNGQGEWTLRNNLTVADAINLNNGKLFLNGKEVITKYFNSSTSNTRTLDLSTSNINIVDGAWNPSNLSNLTFIKGSSEIIIKGSLNSNFLGNGLTYNNVTFRPTTTMSSTLTGANTYTKLRFEGGVNASLEPVIQLATTFEFVGTCAKQIGIQSTSTGNQSTFRQLSGTVNGSFINIKDNVATGGATFNANQSVNLGNSSGWNFSNAPSISIATTSGLVNCQVNNDGWAKVSVLQGTAPFTYLWSTNETTDSIAGLIPGIYNVTVRDSNGCAATDAVSVINLPSALAPVNWDASAYDVCQGTNINFTPNEVSTAIQLDGTNDYVSIPNSATLNSATNATWEGWFYFNSLPSTSTLFSKNTNNFADGYFINVLGNGKLQYNQASDTGNTQTFTTTGVITTGVWTHIAVTKNGATVTIYVNGVQMAQNSAHASSIVTSTNPLKLGASISNSNNIVQFFNGKMDEVRVWNTTRNQTQIQANRNIDLNGNESGLVAYYNMEYNTGTSTLKDMTSNNNNGTLTNMVPATDWVSPGAVNSTISYVWNFGDFTTSNLKTPSKNYTAAGTYNVSLGTYDKNGCPNFVSKTIRVSQLVVSVIKSNIQCRGADNGTISITASGGILPYSYSIDNGATYSSSSDFTGLTAGTYQVKVRDSIGCTSAVQSQVISQPATALAFTKVQNGPICPFSTAGTITVTASGGSTPYQYSKNAGISYQSSNLFDLLTSGTYTIRVRDANNCLAADQSVTITDVDTIKPVFTSCPSNITVNTSGACVATVNYAAPTATDNCKTPAITRTQGLASGSAFPLGVTTVTYMADDSSGNTINCTFTVTVVDNQNPTISCPSTVTVNAINGTCAAIATYAVTATDNCGIQSVVYSIASGSSFNVGTTPVTVTATDVNNRVSTCSFNVVVVDNQNPVITCPANISVNADAGNCSAVIASLGTPTSSDNCGVALVSNNHPSTSYPVGITNVTWTVTDVNGRIANCVQTVTVTDTQDPTITCPSNISVFANTGNCSAVVSSLGTPTTADNCGVASTTNNHPSTTYPVGVTNVTWTVTDVNGRTATCVQTVTVTDNQNPTITAPANVTVNVDAGLCSASGISLGTPVTSDNCSVDSVWNDAGSSFNKGTTNVTWYVRDINGNSNSTIQTVTVNDNIAPTLICKVDTAILNALGTVTITSSDVVSTSSDNCGVPVLTLSQSTFGLSEIGNNIVIVTSTDASNNITRCTTTVVVVEPAPHAFCKNATVYLDASGHATIVPADIDNGSYSLIGISNRTVSQSAFNCSHVGNNTDTLTVYNSFNRSASCVATVTVLDTIAPTAIAQNVDIYLNASGTASTTASAVNNGSYDNCSIASLSLSKTDFTCSNVGNNNVVLTVLDVNGNSSTVNATVIVHDNINPTAIAQNADIYLNASGTASTTAVAVNNASYDNCGIASISLSKTDFNCSNVGNNNVVLTVLDVNGNTSTVNATVIVHDNINPTAIAQNVDIYLNASGAAFTTASAVNNGSYDNCGIASISLSKTDFNCSNVGNNNVVLTVLDVNGNSSTVNATVIVHDNIAPTAITQNISITLVGGAASITATDVNNGSFDNCGIASLAVSKTSFYCTNLGPNTVTLTVTDVNGNISTQTAMVTVIGAIPTASIAQGVQPGFTQGGAIVLTASSPTAVSYSWTGGPATAVYYVYASGTYTVTATNSYGCTVNASTAVIYNASNLLSSYVIIGKEEVEIKNHSVVYNGGVGVTDANGEAEIKDYSTITASGTFVRADDIQVNSNSSVTTKIFTPAPTSILPAFLFNPYCTSSSCSNGHHGSHSGSCSHSHHSSCSHHSNNCNHSHHQSACASSCSHSHHASCNNHNNNSNNNKNVGQGTTVTITDSIMGTVVLGKNSTVTFTAARIYIKDLEIKEGATVNFTQCAVIRVCNHVKIGEDARFNTVNSTIVTIYVEKKLDVKEGAHVTANVYSLKDIKIKGKSPSQPTIMKGLFIGEEVEAEKYVYFYWNTNTTCPNNNFKTEFAADEEGLIKTYFDVNLYPNPTEGNFNVRLFSSSNEPYSIEVYDMNGKMVLSDLVQNAALQHEMNAEFADGMYVVKITQGTQSKTLRLVRTH
ncbi:MAG: HYR domain-containing protein [Bacteroidota bacterium]|nr:HYR domain-containing protein [Bacteroidota bacterium]